ncbi:hypothetical protein PLESTB_000929800 [Pleodorina starrii]|uniref:Coiled-coil domain-containing protein 86 n=1 Tax=Pleodorina starrii TaxID=330485 RepID=A0A9W6F3F0_9CHLO|nr:hypothetical protein PLESTM_001555400 [Pleodorina starrii]GLC55002.1 hypothetical protein PLESTB_000929800 [Pleodorina starrii]GLC68433.1 hypothetical protein PLESTF_000691100 [Pleodorina starrii]
MADEWVPAQYPKGVDTVDLRRLTGVQPKGFKERTAGKRKRDAEEQAEDEQPEAMQEEDTQPAAGHSEKRQKADETTYRPVSGKTWKAPGQRASTVMRPATLGKKSWGKRMTEKAARKHILEQKAEAVAAAKAKRKAAAEQRKAAKERKTANQQKSAVVQKITNSATVKKMMKDKKQRKLLRTADTN